MYLSTSLYIVMLQSVWGLAVPSPSPTTTDPTPSVQAAAFPSLSFPNPFPPPSQPTQSSSAGNLPTIQLPYQKVRATKYVKEIDTYVFKNIRFARAPEGQLRFARPQPPLQNDTLSDGSYGPQCIQSLSISNIPNLDLAGILDFGDEPSILTPLLDDIKPLIMELGKDGVVDQLVSILRPLLGPGGPLSAFPGTIGDLIDALSGVLGLGQAEDCLFLDVYVPGAAMNRKAKTLPVVHWIYGGAYIFGTKDGLYDGFGLIERSQGGLIFVASNYRIGAYGFVAGRTAERANATNLGFHDQHSAFQWIQDNIGLFGGDKTQVTAMGESAGAGSIMHQLTAFGGSQDPLFRKAIVQSPAFQPSADRDGLVEDTFKAFEMAAGCAGKGFDCLRQASNDAIMKANEAVIKAAPPGTFGFGPSADGDIVRQSPGNEFATGNFFKGMDSLIISHVSNEPTLFTSPNIQTQAQLDAFEKMLLPNIPPVQNSLEARFQQMQTVQSRYSDLIQGSSFSCNVRYITNAFSGKTFNIQYAKARGTHGSDISPTFYSMQSPLTSLIGFINPDIPKIGMKMQAIFASYIMTGDPNPAGSQMLSKVVDTTADALSPVLNIDDQFTTISDPDTTRGDCDFWQDLIAGATNLAGYAPPGAAANSSLNSQAMPGLTDPSRNYFELVSLLNTTSAVNAAKLTVVGNGEIGATPNESSSSQKSMASRGDCGFWFATLTAVLTSTIFAQVV